MSKDPCSAFCNQESYDPSSKQNSYAVVIPKDFKRIEVHVEEIKTRANQLIKTTIDVLGICCPAEVPLIKKILEPLPGVEEVLVNVAAKTATVRHDPTLTSAAWLVKALNDSKLEASIHHQGQWKASHKWPSPYTLASGCLVAVAFFQYIYHPLRWAGLGAVAVGMPPILIRSFISLRRCILDINILMVIAVSGAIGLGDYLEAGSIVFLFTLADWLESRSSDKARQAISHVANLAPQYAFLASDGLQVPVAKVEVGTRLSVRAGDMVPIDGVVVMGSSTVDESTLTGEPLPVEKSQGSTVWAGTLNLTGYLCIETVALAEDSAVSRMIRLVEEAQTQRSHLERVVETFAKYYTPVVVITAVAVATLPLSLHAHNTRHWFYLALILLVVACPCALVISTPVTTTCAIAQAARMGLIIKGGNSLEALGKLKVIAMDKTGTLTEGHFQIANVWPLNKTVDPEKLIYWIASVENKSSHPMAASFIAYAKLRGFEPSGTVEEFNVLAGEGISGVVDSRLIQIGNERMAERLHWTSVDGIELAMLEAWKSQGWTISWVGVNGELQGLIAAGDHLRSEAKEAINDMRKLGLQIAMLTGDSQSAADVTKSKLGEIDVHAQLLPQDKVEVIKNLKKSGRTAMIGDGTNDAPALAAADLGIAMGVAGSAIAMETADIALMTNDLRKLAEAVNLGRRAFRKILQNIIFSVTTKLLIIILAAVGYASLWGAVVADVGTCLVVIFNSMLLLGKKKDEDNCCNSHDHSHNHTHSHHSESEHNCHSHNHNWHYVSKHTCHNQHDNEESHSCHTHNEHQNLCKRPRRHCHHQNEDDHCHSHHHYEHDNENKLCQSDNHPDQSNNDHDGEHKDRCNNCHHEHDDHHHDSKALKKRSYHHHHCKDHTITSWSLYKRVPYTISLQCCRFESICHQKKNNKMTSRTKNAKKKCGTDSCAHLHSKTKTEDTTVVSAVTRDEGTGKLVKTPVSDALKIDTEDLLCASYCCIGETSSITSKLEAGHVLA